MVYNYSINENSKKKKKKWIKKKKHIFLVCTAWFVCTYGNPEIA